MDALPTNAPAAPAPRRAWPTAALVSTFAVAAAVVGVAGVVAQGMLARAAEPALAVLREDVLERVLLLDHQRVEEAGVGDLVSRVGDDVRTIGRSLEVVVVPAALSAPYYRRERVAQGARAEALVTGLHSAETLRAYRLEGHQVSRIRDASWSAPGSSSTSGPC